MLAAKSRGAVCCTVSKQLRRRRRQWLDAGTVNVSLSAALEALEPIYHWAARITQARTSLPKMIIDIDYR